MKQLQAGKATGPDMIPAELIKRVPYVVQMLLLLSHYNKCLRMGSIPDGWLLSEVVSHVSQRFRHATWDLEYADDPYQCQAHMYN